MSTITYAKTPNRVRMVIREKGKKPEVIWFPTVQRARLWLNREHEKGREIEWVDDV